MQGVECTNIKDLLVGCFESAPMSCTREKRMVALRYVLLLCIVGVSKHWKNERRLKVTDDLVGGILLVHLGENK